MTENKTEDVKPAGKAFPKKGSIYKIIAIAVFLGIFTGIILGLLYYYFFMTSEKSVLSFVPEDAHLVSSFRIDGGIARMVLAEQYDKAFEDEKSRETMKSIGDGILMAMFFPEPRQGLEFTEEFLNYVQPDVSISFFNVSESLALRLPQTIRKEDFLSVSINKLGVFRITDKEKVEEFFDKVNKRYNISEKEVDGHKIFMSQNLSYVIKDDFTVLSTDPDLLLLSLDTIDGKHNSILDNDKFRLFKKKLSKNTVSFLFVNLNYLREDLYSVVEFSEDSKLAGFFNSFKLLGTGLALSEEGLLLETFILPEKTLSPLAEKFFSQHVEEPHALKLFSKESTTNTIYITDTVTFIELIQGLSDELFSGQELVDLIEGALQFGISEQDIIDSLTGEMAFSLPAKSIGEIGVSFLLDPQMLLGGALFLAGLKEDSTLGNYIATGSSFISMFSPPTRYKDVDIINDPSGNLSYALTGNYIIVSTGKSHGRLEDCIKAQTGETPSLYDLYVERAGGRFPVATTGVVYINTKLLYDNFFRGLPGGDNDSQVRILDRIPEIWLTTSTADNGYKSTIYIPLIIFEDN